LSNWIDTHLHLIFPDQLHYDWIAAHPLQRAFTLEEYRVEARALGIARSVYVEVDVRESDIERETEIIGALADRTNGALAGVVSSCRPENEDERAFAAFAERALADPHVKGFRRVLHVMPDQLSRSSRFRSNLRRLTCAGHPFELCIRPTQLPIAEELARACPNTVFILDHCGSPDTAAGFDSDAGREWRRNLRRLAASPNVHCKLSGLIAHADSASWPHGEAAYPIIAETLQPYIVLALDLFGWDRVVWGSDYPVCTLSRGMTVWKRACDLVLRGESGAHIRRLARENAIRLYRLSAQDDAPRLWL
jgi:predicted TIM-barrel fold metal-dependent hydrolase